MKKLEYSNIFVDTNEILDRLKKAKNIHTDADLARFLKVNPSTVATWRVKKSMKYDRIIEYAYDIDLNWLFTGREILKKNKKAIEIAPSGNQAETEHVPYFSTIVSSSDKQVHFQETENLIKLALPKSFLDDSQEPDSGEVFVTRAIGDSMEPTICNLDYIIVRKTNETTYGGRLYLIRIDQSIMCKRIIELPGNKLLLMNDNPRYNNTEVHNDGFDYEIIGRIIAHIRIL